MNWQSYIRASWEIVMECESLSQVSLAEEMEAYLVHRSATVACSSMPGTYNAQRWWGVITMKSWGRPLIPALLACRVLWISC